MAFFVLIPFYWLASIMIYAASPRQQIKPLENKQKQQEGIVPITTAWASFTVINIASFIWLVMNHWSMIVVTISLLLMNMLLVPSSIILLAHKPHWLKPSSFILIIVCALAQLMAEGQRYVA